MKATPWSTGQWRVTVDSGVLMASGIQGQGPATVGGGGSRNTQGQLAEMLRAEAIVLQPAGLEALKYFNNQ